MLLGKGRVCLQDSAFAEEVEEVSIWSILNGDVQVAWGRQEEVGLLGFSPAKRNGQLGRGCGAGVGWDSPHPCSHRHPAS